MAIRSTVVVLFFTVASALAGDTHEDAYLRDVIKDALYFINACGSKDLSLCLKEKMLHYLELLPDSFELGGIVKIKRLEEGNSTGRQNAAPALPDEPRARENALDGVLMDKVADFVGGHSIEFKLPQETIGEIKNDFVEEGRKKKGKKGGGMGLLLLFYMKMAMLGAVALKVLALLAFKALVIGKIALTISGVIALKKLFEQKHHTSTYEVIAHPHYEEVNQHDRSYGHDLAYRGRLP